MTSKIVVNNIEADAGVSTVTFNSNVERGSSNLHSTGLNVNDTFVHSTGISLGAGSTVGAVTGVTTYYGDGSNLTGINTAFGSGTSINTSGIITATSFVGNGAGLTNVSAGKILQVVHVTKTDHFSSTSTTYTDITGMAASITPTSASSDIIVRFDVQIGGTNNVYAHAKCQRLIAGGSYADLQIGDATGSHERANMNMDSDVSYGYVKGYNNSFSLKDTTHNTTSQITYKLVGHCSAGTFYINRYNHDSTNSTAGTSSVMLMEVSS
jgi:hypothetical protein